MEATLEVTEGGGDRRARRPTREHGSHDDMDYEADDRRMLDTMAQFPAETEGAGNPVLEPTEVKADGTKVFDLTAEIADWEVAPGDVVRGLDLQRHGARPRRSTSRSATRSSSGCTNDLPIATDLHLHGLNVDNAVRRRGAASPRTSSSPATTFTYEYTADEVAVAMYHPHFHWPDAGCPTACSARSSSARVPLPRGQTVGGEAIPADLEISPGDPDGAQRLRRDRLHPQRQELPGHRPDHGQAVGDWVLIHYFNEGTQIHPMHLHQFDQIVRGQGRLPARRALRGRHAERGPRRALLGARAARQARRLGLALPHPPPRRGRGRACSAWSPPSSSSSRDQRPTHPARAALPIHRRTQEHASHDDLT